MIRVLMVAAAALLAGCASSNDAGIAHYTAKPVVVDGQTVCCEIDVTNGKNIASVTVHIAKTGQDTFTVDLTENGVNGSTGQQIVSDTATSVTTAVSNAAVSAVQIIHPLSVP